MRRWAIAVGAVIVFGAGILVGKRTSRTAHQEISVLSVPVVNTSAMDVGSINARLTEEHSYGTDLPAAIGMILPALSASLSRELVVLAKRGEGDAQVYRVDVLQSEVPDDDSVSGRYRSLAIARDDKGNWRVASAAEAWRCWDERGHADFDNTPCL